MRRADRLLRHGLVLLALTTLAGAALADCPRIVSQSPYITRALQWFGLGKCIVGVSRYDTLDRPRTGGVMDPDVDAIFVLDPQLMITSDWTKPEVWQAATPPGAKAVRVGGFRSMADVEAMLRDIGHAAGVADTDARVKRFHRDWRAAAKRANGHGRRVLIIAACGGVPYSYGHDTVLYDLFTRAGYHVVETADTLRHLRPGEQYQTIPQLVGALHPQALIALVNQRSPSCNAELAQAGVPVVAIDDDKFVHPGPDLVEALDELWEKSHD